MALMSRLGFSSKVVLLGSVVLLPLMGSYVQFGLGIPLGIPTPVGPGLSVWPAMAGAICLLLVVYVLISFSLSVSSSFGDLDAMVAALADGRLDAGKALGAQDELARMGNDLNHTMTRLSGLVADIRSNAAVVSLTGGRLGDETHQLSARTETQAASLQQTAASVRELTETVTRSAQSARDVDAMADNLRLAAESGAAAIAAAVQSIQGIQTGSRRMNDIISVIESIAFQTNLLALNAAVEAARAGDQGRGFAVVASEVRALAQRSSAAAGEIKTLIRQSVQEVALGVEQTGSVNQTFDAISARIHDLAEQVRSIADNAHEQSAGLAQISQAVAHIDEITQQNAQMAEAASLAARELNERAARLGQSVSLFRLRQGTADEAVALVRQAMELFRQRGKAALGAMTASTSLVDRDMYVFAFDRRGVYLAAAGKPERVNQTLSSVPGLDGNKLVADAFVQVARGGGWVDYTIFNPATGKVDQKTSYVEPAGPDLVVGCGIYKAQTGDVAVTATR
jgi:methyl-accepting chemotaxis protein